MSSSGLVQRGSVHLGQWQLLGDGLAQILVALLVLTLAIMAFAISSLSGVIVTFIATLAVCQFRTAATPTLVVAGFLLQNTFIAALMPLFGADASFDMMRAVNFIILMSASGMAVLYALLNWPAMSPILRRWVAGVLIVAAIIVLYFGLGAVRGDARDAIVYLRNTLSPLCTLGLGLVLGGIVGKRADSPIVILGFAALAFGYLELIFGFDFLSIFNGDAYVQRDIQRAIESGYWERVLAETGFVLQSLDDVMRVPFLNLPIFSDIVVFRVGGPNFHPISFAYFLAIVAVWQLFRGAPLFLLASLPLLVFIGSKGALILIGFSFAMIVANRLLGFRLTLAGFIVGLFSYLGVAIVYGRATGDYHVLGFLAGVRDFLSNPIGQGLGFGGNLSTTTEGVLDWSRAQQQGIADIPVESAVGVMLYQLGIGALAMFGLFLAVARASGRGYLRTGQGEALFAMTAICVTLANAVLQEEAIYSPLAMSFCLLLAGLWLGRNFFDPETISRGYR